MNITSVKIEGNLSQFLQHPPKKGDLHFYWKLGKWCGAINKNNHDNKGGGKMMEGNSPPDNIWNKLPYGHGSPDFKLLLKVHRVIPSPALYKYYANTPSRTTISQ
jgi:hypothetical protein